MYINRISENVSMQGIVNQLKNLSKAPSSIETTPAMPTGFDVKSFSALSKKMADYYKELSANGDAQSKEGLRQLAIDLSNNPSSVDNKNLTSSLDALKSADSEGFSNFFKAYDELKSGRHSTSEFLNSFLALDNTYQQSQLVDITRNIISSEGNQRDISSTLNNLFELTKSSAQIDKNEENNMINELFSKINDLNSLDSFKNAFTDFRNQYPNL